MREVPAQQVKEMVATIPIGSPPCSVLATTHPVTVVCGDKRVRLDVGQLVAVADGKIGDPVPISKP